LTGEAVAAPFDRLHALPILGAGMQYGDFEGFFLHKNQVRKLQPSLIDNQGELVNQWMRQGPVFHKNQLNQRPIKKTLTASP
jgi:hypothetical protein